MTNDELIQKTQALLDEQEAADRFSGSVLVARSDQLLLKEARGYAIHPQVVRNQTDTRFNIASVTKMFTAVAVVQLVARGKLDLHTPVATYNPTLPHASDITIHQLLTHTAGFDDTCGNLIQIFQLNAWLLGKSCRPSPVETVQLLAKQSR